jgi:hypothetical protein
MYAEQFLANIVFHDYQFLANIVFHDYQLLANLVFYAEQLTGVKKARLKCSELIGSVRNK